MAINPTCDMCKKELVDFGGLLFSPPEQSVDGQTSNVASHTPVSKVEKYHICKSCWIKVRKMLG